jgi:hypothetical protein
MRARGIKHSIPRNQTAGHRCSVSQAVDGQFRIVGSAGSGRAGLVKESGFAAAANQFHVVLDEVVAQGCHRRQLELSLNEVSVRCSMILKGEKAANECLGQCFDGAEWDAP